ncbi:hypothetical protein BAY32_13935 [Elizabethkingia ursingii]|uniref:Uncharacterized protein n=1 Tax=Elizabethkingia ursingii TaxID=1756150 RepID=A0AAJ3NG93_9FLAO|nr:hypothetical protein BBD34_01810 [Elizabethkingia ursingii]OPB81024.1 hypothetical protein BAY32_13935 [Elizabethkingia ursingii]
MGNQLFYNRKLLNFPGIINLINNIIELYTANCYFLFQTMDFLRIKQVDKPLYYANILSKSRTGDMPGV